MPDYSRSGSNRDNPLTSGDPRTPIRHKLRAKGIALDHEKQPVNDLLTNISDVGIADNKILVGTGDNTVAKVSITDFAYTILDDTGGAAVCTTISAQPVDATLTALAGLSTSANQVPYSTGSDAFSMASLTAFARTLLDDADASAARATLGVQALDATLTALAGLSTSADQVAYSTGSDAFSMTSLTAFARTLLDDANASTARATLSAQALDATLTALAGLATGADKIPYSTGTDAFSQATLTSFARTLIDDTTAEAARQTLDVGNTEQHSVWYQDYLVPSAAALGWSSSSSNGGFAQSWATISDASNSTGVVELNTASHRSGRYALLSWNDALVFNNETAYTFEARVNVSALSTSGDEYKATFGFSNKFNEEAGGSNETDYAYWIYRRSVDGDFWVAATAKDGTEEKTVTTTAPVGNDTTFVVLKIVVPADGSSVTYYIDGVEKAAHDTNVPAVTDRLGIGLRINKTAGTTEREFRVDWHRFTTTRTAAR